MDFEGGTLRSNKVSEEFININYLGSPGFLDPFGAPQKFHGLINIKCLGSPGFFDPFGPPQLGLYNFHKSLSRSCRRLLFCAEKEKPSGKAIPAGIVQDLFL